MHDLADRHPGLTTAVAASYLEAARVCLDRHHEPPVDVVIQDGIDQLQTKATWEPTDERTRGAWANDIDTTEAGAYACVLAAVELVHQLFAVRRAETRTGADYYLARAGEGVDDLESCFRLEVSGVDAGPQGIVGGRLVAKAMQASKGASNLPAIAGVIGFKALVVALRTVVDE